MSIAVVLVGLSMVFATGFVVGMATERLRASGELRGDDGYEP